VEEHRKVKIVVRNKQVETFISMKGGEFKMVKVLFPVEERKLIVQGGAVIPHKKAIVRSDTNQVLGIVSDRYKLVKHEEVIGCVNDALKEIGMKETERSLCHNGANLFIKYRGNGEYSKEVKVGDIVRFGLEIFNSYNSSMPVGVVLIAERLKCVNGMIVPETLSSFSVKHYGKLDLSDVRRKSLVILERIPIYLERWQSWSKKDLSVDIARQFFNRSFGKRMREMLFQKFLVEREEDTVWGLYNFFTRYLSHEIRTRRGNEQNLRMLQWSRELDITGKLTKWVNKELG
jgi:hypothetical protein